MARFSFIHFMADWISGHKYSSKQSCRNECGKNQFY